MSLSCAWTLNGSVREVAVEAADTLLTVLREKLAYTGAKRGCNQGVCGACTVLVDGSPMRSCLLLAANCGGTQITTVEGLEHDRIGALLQQAFETTGAVQCGFCTPGMLISARALLAENPQPSIEDVRAGLSGNLCRCSGYRKIIEAVRQAAAEMAE